jgi:hypothetical protein
MRTAVIRALNRLREDQTFLKFDRRQIEDHFHREIQRYLKTLTHCIALRTYCLIKKNQRIKYHDEDSMNKARQLVMIAVSERLDDYLEVMFILLGLIYPQKDMTNAYQAVISEKTHLKADAIEFLENTLTTNLKREIIWILDHRFDNDDGLFPQKLQAYKPDSEEETLRNLLERNDYWIVSCTLYLMATVGIYEPQWLVKKLTKHHHGIVRETAEFLLHQGEINA